MKKYFLIFMLITVLSLTMFTTFISASDEPVTATPTVSNVLVDGVEKSFDAYFIDNNNYFKLRDIAFVLTGTSSQFEVTWDESQNSINLKSNMPYTALGGEMSVSETNESKSAVPTPSNIYLDGNEIELTAYFIDGNNYFKLRDLGTALNFDVDWDSETNTILINTVNENKENSDTVITKSFGTYVIPEGWSESPQLSSDEKFFYLKDGTDLNNPTSNISVEAGTNRYSEDDFLSFRDAIYRQLLIQVSKSPAVSYVTGEGSYTEKGYVLIIFTIEEESLNTVTKHYYIVGDYSYIFIWETDYQDENIPDISEVARAIVDSFEWSE